MKIPKNVLTVLILHKSLKWSKVSLSSFLEIFDGDLVIIDNNFKKDGLESEYVKNTFGITPLFNNKSSRVHGSGLDFAFDYAKKNNYDHILHIEPDCVFYDNIWFDKLYNEFLKSNSWVCTNGSLMGTAFVDNGHSPDSHPWLDMGRRHFCSSVWDVNAPLKSFIPKTIYRLMCDGGFDVKYVTNIKWKSKESNLTIDQEMESWEELDLCYLMRNTKGNILIPLLKYNIPLLYFDTAVMNQYICESLEKSSYVNNTVGFYHITHGSEYYDHHRVETDKWWENSLFEIPTFSTIDIKKQTNILKVIEKYNKSLLPL